MKTAVYYTNDDIRIEDRSLPEIKEGQILVKMMASGICGTDVMEWYRRKKAPRVLGHEMAGVIVDIGHGVDRFKKGDRVFVSHHVPCYSCHYCRFSNYTACEMLHKGNYDPGGFSEYVKIPEQNVKHGTFYLPEEMTFEEATMIEPLGCAVAGHGLLELKEGQSVLIMGSGVSGLLHIQLAKLRNAHVIATDIDGYRLQKAQEFGADHVFNAAEYSVEKFKEVNNRRLADKVVVCAGVEAVLSDAVASIDRKGTILFFAVPESMLHIPSVQFWRNEITVTFSYGAASEHLQESIELIHKGLIDVRNMITHKVPLSDIQEGFRIVSEAKNSIKVVVVPDEGVGDSL